MSSERVSVVLSELPRHGLRRGPPERGLLVSRMSDDGNHRVNRAIHACRRAGLAVVESGGCSCGLCGQLVVLAQPDGLRVMWPYDERCRVHDPRERERQRPVQRDLSGHSCSQAASAPTLPPGPSASPPPCAPLCYSNRSRTSALISIEEIPPR
jgi:hypothetical protein